MKGKGEFKDGLKTGIWCFYNDNDELISKFDYTESKLVYYKPSNEEFLIVGNFGQDVAKLDQPPLFFPKKDISETDSQISIPDQPSLNGVQGTVHTIWVLNEEGEMVDLFISKGLEKNCNNEALRLVKSISENNILIPGLLKGKPVEVMFELPIIFGVQ